MIFNPFKRRNPNAEIVERLYQLLSDAAREPVFYRDLGVPDTVEGRFDMMVIHAFLLLRRLQALPDPAGELAQDLVDTVFGYFDLALRELGVGDISVPKRMKTLASAFYGRTKAYEAAMGSEDYLAAALELNLFNRSVAVPGAPRLVAAYMRNAAALLERCAFDDFVAARIEFPALPPEKNL